MAYDPFQRGLYPVGVRTLQLVDEARGQRPLPTEIWYPAADAYAGRDLAADAFELIPGFPPLTQDAVRDAVPRAGRWPLVAFSHGYTAHRRQTTFLCTHLASHGYVVASADHTGNTVHEVVQAMMSGRWPDQAETLRRSIADRPADVAFVIDHVLAEADGLGELVDPERIGMTGHSFGGWTTLAVTARDRRVRAALPLAPAGGENPLGANVLGEMLDFAWGRDVPTLFLVADQDNILPLPGMHELYGRTQATKKMVVLYDADHMHFCDNVEQVHEMFRTMPTDPLFAPAVANIRPIGELCPGTHAYDLIRGLGLAHMDAALKGDARATALLGGDVRATMAGRGVRVDVP